MNNEQCLYVCTCYYCCLRLIVATICDFNRTAARAKGVRKDNPEMWSNNGEGSRNYAKGVQRSLNVRVHVCD